MTFTLGKMNGEEIKAEYTSSLGDLTFNSKPLINMLTMLAEENLQHGSFIVQAIEEHLDKVQTNCKLPILYLIDCIAKNIGQSYTQLFSQNIVKTFCNVFKVVDEETRAEMFKLRQTWNSIFPQKKLYAIDVQINMLDPAWPVTAQPTSNSIHFNPKFLQNAKPKADSSLVPNPSAGNLDMETFTMQQKLIQKQKELIELQQKKLKLELLQTQVKLQKQMEGNPNIPVGGTLPSRTQNILLKPEVAKQLMPEVAKQLVPGGVRDSKKANLGANARQGAAPRIAPVNSALIAAATKPTRDPRLLRQLAEKASNGTALNTNSSSSVALGSKPTLLDSNNKVVTTNAKSVRDSRVEARLVTKDIALPTQNKPDKSKTFPKSRLLEQKSIKFQRKHTIPDESLAVKNCLIKKSDKSEKSSPTKHKKKDDKRVFKETKREKSSKNDVAPASFKGVKSKNRNYIRKNRSPSFSPELTGQDVDLRLVGPPEKQARLAQIETAEDKLAAKVINAPGMDVDLRHLGEVSKKRSSSDNSETTITIVSKKSKNEVLDALFGNEDTDLRTVLTVAQPERPPTPPPPIISYTEKEKAKESPKKSSDFETVRAKLANATGRDKVMAKCFRKRRPQEDEDLRVPPASLNDSLKKIIISSDDEQNIKTGTLTKEQEQQLMNKIIAQIEQQKLQEAQLRDKEETDCLQPVSDEELDFPEETEHFGDKDDRVNFPNFSREMRRGGSYWRGSKRRHWENPHPRPPARPWLNQMNQWRPMGPGFNRPIPDFNDHGPEVPHEVTVDSVNQGDIKTINIDKFPRDIRYYDETAIVFMNWDDPREISFQDGSRHMIFDDKEAYLLSFNEGYKEVSVNGKLHRVKLGAPTREIFIDGNPYECYFGSSGITIELDGRMTTVKLEKPPPDVRIGTVKRTDLVAGKVNLIIDAKILVPVFLDAKLQKFVIEGETHTLKFVDALKTVLINDVPFKVEFGGLPKPITVHDKKHFIRFSVLPKGIKPGVVRIRDMEGGQVTELDDGQDDAAEPALPALGAKKKVEDESDRNSNSPHFFQSFMQQNNLDVLSSVMTSSMAPMLSSGGYQVENLVPNETQSSQSVDSVPVTNPTPILPPSLNINELFQKLVATGIVATKEPAEPPPRNPEPLPPRRNLVPDVQMHHRNLPDAHPPRRNPLESIRPVTFNRPESLKMRQSAIYESLYAGMQCSGCGMRFPPEQSMRYSQHLDWHFRQNRKGKRNVRVGATRRWFYSLADWMNYVEVEDLEERENYFDQQQIQAEGAAEEMEEETEVPSVPADAEVQETHCEVCRDKFEQFFNEDKEEWHLRNAIRMEGKTYHPVCYEDYQNSLEMEQDSRVEEEDEIKEKTEEQNIPGLEIILDDDDDDVEEVPKDDEVIIEESDESKASNLEEVRGEAPEEEDDDDVIINEVVPEKIEVDDDKEYETCTTNDVPIKVEHVDDGFMDVDEGGVKIKGVGQIVIKSEPIDPDEVTLVTPAEEEPAPFTELSQPTFISSIDGNTECGASIPTTTANIGSKIRINISKPLPVIAHKETRDISCDSVSLDPVIDPSQPLPPGEETIQLNIKPALQGVELKKLPLVQRGSELTGMCSIM